VIHVASPLAGRRDAESTIDVGVTLFSPMGTLTDAIHLRLTECSPRVDERPPSSHQRRNQTVLDCKQRRGRHGLHQRAKLAKYHRRWCGQFHPSGGSKWSLTPESDRLEPRDARTGPCKR
jgi:hypothetical protein